MKSNEKLLKIGWIAGMPRSGSTWLSQIFASCPDVRLKLCPLFSFEFKNAVDETSDASQWTNFFSDVYRTKSDYLDQEFLRKEGLVPTFANKKLHPEHLFIKTNRFHNLVPHLLKLNLQIRFIHIIRHPCACIYSWISNPFEFPKNADPKHEWRSGSCRKTAAGEFWGFNDWKQVTQQALLLTKTYPDQHKIIRYEDLVNNPIRQTRKLFEYFKLPFGKQTEEFLKHSTRRHNPHRRSVFKNPKRNVSWQEKLDPSIVSACLNELKGSELEQFTKL